jgi:hypothetical protein
MDPRLREDDAICNVLRLGRACESFSLRAAHAIQGLRVVTQNIHDAIQIRWHLAGDWLAEVELVLRSIDDLEVR